MKLNKLYKRSTTNKISEWEIEVEGDKFRTISGFSDGQKVTSEWTICKGKSYNNSEDQALKQAKAIHKKKIEQGAFEKLSDIDKPRLFEPMLAIKLEDCKDKIKFPIASQPKLDGMRCIINKSGMWSRKGKEVVSAPHIFESVKSIFETYPDLVLDGELYCDKLANDFNKIISCVRKTKPTQEDLEESKSFISFFCYDYFSEDNFNFSHRTKSLQSVYNLNEYKYVVLVPTFVLNSKEEIKIQFDKYIENGYEGQILRVLDSLYENKRSKGLIKDKDMVTDEFICLRVNEGKGKLANKAGTITIKTKDGIEVDCTVNGTHEFLADLWMRKDEIPGKDTTVRFFGFTPDGSLRFPKVIDIDRWSYE